MYIVLELCQDEFGRGNSRPIHKFDDENDMVTFVTTYRGDASQLEIFKATPMAVKVSVVPVDTYSERW